MAASAALLRPSDLHAQRQADDPRYLRTEDGTPDLDLEARARAGGFRLFANSDLAAVGMHGAGNFATAVSNYGPCENNQILWNCLRIFNAAHTATNFVGFDLNLVLAAPASEWNRARALVPSLGDVLGGGYTVIQDFTLSSRPLIGPDDGSVARDFTGALSTAGDGACTDNSANLNGFVSAGVQLLPSPTCPVTLPGGVFGGEHPIPEDSWYQLARAQGSSFRWNFWRVPESLKRQNSFLGNQFSTFGYISDHFREVLALYGSVVPGTTGAPRVEGWPLGIRIRFDAFDFNAPALASAYFYQVLLINDSRQVYGVGLDYDSLYFALEHGLAFAGDTPANYFEPQRSAFVATGNGVNLGCNGATNPAGNHRCMTAANRGFNGGGAFAAVVLKSPIGDLRNKLFTRPGSRFYGLGDPRSYDDTIGFNHGHMCGFGGCNSNTHTINNRRSYGMFASRPADVLDGRAPSNLDASQFWRTFRNRQFPSQIPLFNTMVPGTVAGYGTWDWNNDGVQDTLWFDTCGGPHNMADLGAAPVGCVRTFADTLPGRQNDRYANTGGVIGVGPFRLAAGDTTGFLFAFLGEPDSLQFEATMQSVLDAYLTFFVVPEAPPAPAVISSEVTSNSATNARLVSLVYGSAPERWVDPYLLKVAGDIQSATPGTLRNFGGQVFDLDRLRRLNPNFVSQIRAQAADNFSALYVYKSCDGGRTFTADASCLGAPATDEAGRPVGAGWRPYAILRRPTAQGALPNVFADANIIGGRTYLYSLVTKSRGAFFGVVDSAAGALATRRLALADSVAGPLVTNGASVVSVYVPASRAAGGGEASASLASQEGDATVPVTLAVVGQAVAGRYTALFGNKLIHRETTDGSGSITATTVIVQDTVRACSTPPPTCTPAVTALIAADTFTSVSNEGAAIGGTPSSTAIDSVSAPPSRTTTRTFSALGFVLYGPGNNPLFISTRLGKGDAATPASFREQPNFPGFIVSADNSQSALFAGKLTIGPRGDTLSLGGTDSVAGRPQWLQQYNFFGAGTYALTWTSDAWGLPRGLVLNFAHPELAASELAAALASRPTGSVGSTTAATKQVIGTCYTGGVSDPSRPLVAVRAPFTIVNRTFNRPVTIAMCARESNTILLGGTGRDTLRVDIPATEWVPGDWLRIVETVQQDSAVAGLVVLSPDGRPIRVSRVVQTFFQAIIGCVWPRPSCNPVADLTGGATGFVPIEAGTQTIWSYYVGLNRNSKYVFDVTAARRGDSIREVTRAQLDSIRVVPNPFVVYSLYQTSISQPRLLFTHVPPSGVLRIYSVAGQFLKQLSWTPADLNGTGDLAYDLSMSDGSTLGSGLFIWVMTTNVGGVTQRARGKLVVIRGRAQ